MAPRRLHLFVSGLSTTAQRSRDHCLLQKESKLMPVSNLVLLQGFDSMTGKSHPSPFLPLIPNQIQKTDVNGKTSWKVISTVDRWNGELSKMIYSDAVAFNLVYAPRFFTDIRVSGERSPYQISVSSYMGFCGLKHLCGRYCHT